MTATQLDVKDYSYFADNQWRRAEANHFFEVHEPYSGKPNTETEIHQAFEDYRRGRMRAIKS